MNTSVADEIKSVFELQQVQSKRLRISAIKDRKAYLLKLRQWIHKNRTLIHEALYNDFKKPSTEVDSTEIFHVLNEIGQALQNIDNWTKPKKVDAPITLIGTRSFIQYEPRGCCLIISPWNYPFSLSVGPLVSALAAGNRVILKPSELTPHVSALVKKMSHDLFEKETVAVFEGGPEISQHLLSLPFDHIFFTGSPAIGKVVMRAAAEHLTSITLELGGKTPTIVTDSADIKDAAQRIVIAKFINNGQTCIAPDYLFVHQHIYNEFLTELVRRIQRSFTEGGLNLEDSPHYARIVNEKHFDRLNSLLNDAVEKGAKKYFAGQNILAQKFFYPTLLTDVPAESRVLEEEIFGPILPVLKFSDLSEVVKIILSKPKPLALYLFSNDKNEQSKILKETSSGGVCLNDCAIQFLHHNLPFGGINNSGMGKSHGHAGFLAFSHEKPVLKQRKGFTSVKPFYPPYTKFKKSMMNLFLKFF